MAVNQSKVIVGVDVGTSKICALVGEVGRDNHVSIVGVGVEPSRGLSKGVVVNIEETAAAIVSAIEKAERMAGLKIGSVLLGVAGSHIGCFNSRGVIDISKSEGDISYSDVGRAIDAARAVELPAGRDIMHVIPRTFVIDGQDGVRDPVGMSGFRLEVETHIITGATSAVNNLHKATTRLGLEVDEMVLQPLAAGEAVLAEAEKRLGVCLVDIGAGTTDIAIYVDGSIWHTAVLPVGGNHITNDIAIVLRTDLAAAERLKTRYGDASVPDAAKESAYFAGYYDGYGSAVGSLKHKQEGDEEKAEKDIKTDESYIEVKTVEGGQTQQITPGLLNEIIYSRVHQIFEMVQGEIKKSGYDGMVGAGVVVTGGTAALPGLTEAARSVLNVPVRIGVPRDLSGLTDALGSPAYSASIGLMLWGVRHFKTMENLQQPSRSIAVGAGSIPRSNASVGKRVRGWLREFLP